MTTKPYLYQSNLLNSTHKHSKLKYKVNFILISLNTKLLKAELLQTLTTTLKPTVLPYKSLLKATTCSRKHKKNTTSPLKTTSKDSTLHTLYKLKPQFKTKSKLLTPLNNSTHYPSKTPSTLSPYPASNTMTTTNMLPNLFSATTPNLKKYTKLFWVTGTRSTSTSRTQWI